MRTTTDLSNSSNTKPKLAVVLGGGGSRGLAHIGILELLHQLNAPIELIVGTSMGAIVGTAYACGHTPETIIERLEEFAVGNSVFSMSIFSARARQRELGRSLVNVLGHRMFSDLKIKTILMAVDMLTGEEVLLSEGPVLEAVLASSAVPAVFPPVMLNGSQLADGGVIDSLATHVAHQYQPQKIIAVDIYPPLEDEKPWIDPLSAVMGLQLPFNPLSNTEWARIPSMMSSMWRASRVMTWHLHELRLKQHPPDLLSRPEVSGYGSLDFSDVEGPLAAGRESAQKHREEIEALVQSVI